MDYVRQHRLAGTLALPESNLLAAEVAEVGEADQFAFAFVPEAEGEGFEAPEEGHRFHGLKNGVSFVAFLQVIIRNARAEVMEMVIADVSGEPLEHSGQFVEGAALQGGGGVIP